ncbi:P-loop containing nucleoside triphosphate hydrolase protein [Pavlovales sp. CCMP2436]|nr:P-loop containing nucleoside triphosphate hydrolase protein [Pavlovales sp. CCMP2436]
MGNKDGDEADRAAAKAAKKAAKRAVGEGEAPPSKKAKPEAADGGAVADVDAKAARKKEKKEKRAKEEATPAAKGGSTEPAREAGAPKPAKAAPASHAGDEHANYRALHQISVGEGTDAAALPPCVLEFSKAPFAPVLVKALRSAGFASPTPIQAQAWPIMMTGVDLIAVAKTGSGKTLAYLLPTLHAASRLGGDAPKATPFALVLAPTRELAIQINEAGVKYGAALGIKSVCVYGGAPMPAQKTALTRDRPHVVVATPGRLVDLLNQQALSLGACSVITLDEADRMLDIGFGEQISQVFGLLPAKRQTLCFSATWPKAVRKLASTYMRKDATTTLFIGGGVDCELEANTAVSQLFVHATDDEKDKKLYEFLCALEPGARVVVFANTKRRVESLSKRFYDEGFGTCAIHGDKKQNERDASLRSFVNNECPLMFATDVAARGLDIKGVTHVVNFDMAKDVESYVHRIGRTGRAGELGASLTFWNPDYDKECAPALVKIAKDAGQPVPDWLLKFEKTKGSKQWKVEDINMPPAGA